MGFKLQIGGLGLSTVANNDGLTAEQQADLEHFKQSKNEPRKQESDSSDDGLPPPLPVSKPKGLPGLKIGGLGISTLATGNGKTAEEMADMQVLQDAKSKPKEKTYDTDSDDSDAGLPPPIPISKPKGLPGLKIGGLGLSTLANNGGKTAEELGDM